MRDCQLALDLEIGGDVFRRFGHGIDAVLRFHERVDEAPADGGVVHRLVAAKGQLGLWHDEGRAAHALHPARDHQARFSGLDGARGGADGI